MDDFKTAIKLNWIKNCPVTIEDINVAEKVYGRSVHALKDKTTRSKPVPVVNDYVEVPQELIDAQKGIDLCVDVTFIQGVPFFVTVSKRVRYVTIEYIEGRTKSSFDKAFDTVFCIYNKAGFTIKTVFGDPEFDIMRDTFVDLDIDQNVASAQEHVPEIERAICLIKERIRAMWHRMHYSVIPKVMVIALAQECANWLNLFPPKQGVSEYHSQKMIIERVSLDYVKHCTTVLDSMFKL